MSVVHRQERTHLITAARLLDPRIGGRRLIRSWRIGRLRAVLPELAAQIGRRVDAELASLGQLDQYTSVELLEIIQRTRRYLASVGGEAWGVSHVEDALLRTRGGRDEAPMILRGESRGSENMQRLRE